MPLFRYLSDDAFLIFSRRHRFAYEAALLEVHDRFFSTGIAFPNPREVTHVLYDLVARRPDLIEDIDPGEGLPELISKGRRRLRFVDASGESGDRALRFAAQLYQGLLRTGWLEEEEYGLKVTVDMPMGALLVVQRFASLKADVSQRFGGLIVHVKTSLEHVERLADRNTPKNRGDAAHALHTSRTNVEAFAQGLRAILSDLKRIRKALLEAQGLRQKMETYFEAFIGELLLKDFQSILTRNHPYRFRDGIIASARAIYVDRALMDLIEEGYREQGLSPGAEAADDLLAIEQAFETVGEMFERIAQFRRALESRLRNTVKYAEQGERGLGSRARGLVSRLEALLLRAEPGRYDRPTVPASVEPVRSPWSDRHLEHRPEKWTPLSGRCSSHWQDDADRGDLQDRAAAVTTANTLHERYRDLVQSAGKPALPVGRFLELLQELANRNLVEIGAFDRDQQDREITIRSMVKLVSGDEPLRRVEAYVRAEEVRVRSTAAPIPEAAARGTEGGA